MKQLYLKQNVFALKDRYKIYDENQVLTYHCEGKLFSFTHQKDVYRTEDSQLLFTLKKQIISLLPIYFLTNPQGENVATIRKKISILKPKIEIESSFGSFTIDGDFMGHDFTISRDGILMVEFHKKWISWGDTYEIIIHSEENEGFLLALVIMIDDCLYENKAKANHVHHH